MNDSELIKKYNGYETLTGSYSSRQPLRAFHSLKIENLII